MGDTAAIRKTAKEYGGTPRILQVTEFEIEKSGIRFPNRFHIEEAYITKSGKKRIRSVLDAVYRDYKFFTVEVETGDDQTTLVKVPPPFLTPPPISLPDRACGPSFDIGEIDGLRRDLQDARDIAQVLVGTPPTIEVQLLQDHVLRRGEFDLGIFEGLEPPGPQEAALVELVALGDHDIDLQA